MRERVGTWQVDVQERGPATESQRGKHPHDLFVTALRPSCTNTQGKLSNAMFGIAVCAHYSLCYSINTITL
jgi:hypothetical protein